MIKHAAVITLGLMLAACNQSAPPAGESATAATDSPPPGSELPDAARLLAGDVLAGAWEAVGDEATVGTRFTSTETTDEPGSLTIGCNMGNGEAFINWPIGHEATDGDLRIHVAGETVTFAATGSNDDGHLQSVAVAGTDPRLAALRVQQERFAVEGFGLAMRLPWDASIADALNGCAG